jgi:glucose/arabinose dehydrogenase
METATRRLASRLPGLTAGVLALLVAGAPAQEQEFDTARGRVRVTPVANALEHPWGLAFLPDGRLLVTERPGRLRLVGADGRLSEALAGVPEVFARGQGGLLDVVLDPRFSENRLVYLSYAEPGPGGAGTAVARGRLDARGLEGLQVLFRQQPKVSGGNHFGSRLVFGRDGTLFIALGDRYKFDPAQDPNSHLGKIVRVNPDGSVPGDNPFTARAGVRPEIWSLGHRNIQAAALHPATGALWVVEHGPRGGDEVNIPEAGKNYGWPVIGYGRHYSGQAIAEGAAKPGMEQPIYYWDPSIAPSGMAFYTGERFPAWRGNLLVGALVARRLTRLELAGGRVVREEPLLQGLRQRIRDVRQGPDGLVYLLTDEADGRLLRIEPAR